MNEGGGEVVYVAQVDTKVANMGVAVDLASNDSIADPFFLGSLDENSVQGYAGTPTNVNALMFDFLVPIGAAGVLFPRQQPYYVAVDSGENPFTHQQLPGQFRLRSWVNDVKPPTISLLTTTVAAGRPTIAVRTRDPGAGVDPLSIVISYGRVIVGAAAFDPDTGIAVIPLPEAAPTIPSTTRATLSSSDFQETKNVGDTTGENIMPNTVFRTVTLNVVSRPVATWLRPETRACASRPTQQLLLTASSTSRITSVRFLDGKRPIRTLRSGVAGLYSTNWSTRRAKAGTHTLVAVVRDARGRTVTATRTVRVCRR
jgi:hypothetical protein